MHNTTVDLLDDTALEAAAEAITPLPAATSRLLAAASAPDVPVGTIVEIVQYDPGLTAALLGQANSAHSIVVRRITSVHDAVVRLGLDTVVTVAMRTSVAASMAEDLTLYDIDGGRAYRHAVLSAVAGEVLRAGYPARVPPITPTVALLHDIGKFVLSKAVGTRAVELVSVLAAADGRPRHEIETEVFGLHHGQAGRFVINKWRLPTSFLEGIVNHHGDLETPSMFARSVQLADEIAHAADALLDHVEGEPPVTGPCDRPLLVAAAASLGIDAAALDALTEQTAERFEAIAALLAV